MRNNGVCESKRRRVFRERIEEVSEEGREVRHPPRGEAEGVFREAERQTEAEGNRRQEARAEKQQERGEIGEKLSETLYREEHNKRVYPDGGLLCGGRYRYNP